MKTHKTRAGQAASSVSSSPKMRLLFLLVVLPTAVSVSGEQDNAYTRMVDEYYAKPPANSSLSHWSTEVLDADRSSSARAFISLSHLVPTQRYAIPQASETPRDLVLRVAGKFDPVSTEKEALAPLLYAISERDAIVSRLADFREVYDDLFPQGSVEADRLFTTGARERIMAVECLKRLIDALANRWTLTNNIVNGVAVVHPDK